MGSFEGDAVADGSLPTGGGDLDELAFGIGEIEEDLFGEGAVAARIDAAGDADVAGFRVAGGLGFEAMADGGEGVGGGDGFEFGVALAEEPFAEGAGADGEGAGAGDGGRDADKGLAGGGGKGEGAIEDGVEDGEVGEAAGFWGRGLDGHTLDGHEGLFGLVVAAFCL